MSVSLISQLMKAETIYKAFLASVLSSFVLTSVNVVHWKPCVSTGIINERFLINLRTRSHLVILRTNTITKKHFMFL